MLKKFFNIKYFKWLLIFVIVFIILSNLFKIIKIYVEPYYNFKFTRYNYKYPQITENFIINTEPGDAYIPDFLINILKLAFYDRKIVIDNMQVPHFIIRCENVKSHIGKEKYNAPYISLSAERWTLKRHKYRKNGPPIAEIVSTTPKKAREFYFPFMIWYGLEPKRIYFQNDNHKKFLVYIASNCIAKREQLFALIKKLVPNVDALGICSNAKKKNRFPGGYGNLDEVYAKYKFGFAMENHQISGYITEKIINVFRGGAIPIYWGDTNTVNKYFNPKAFINVDQFKSLQQAAEYIVNLSDEQIQHMQNQPIFANNIVPDIFQATKDPDHHLLKKTAIFIRNEYFKQINS